MIEIAAYTPAFASRWDEFVAASRNATFLFMRGYMDYHSDRFADASVVALKGGRVVALLPANVDGTVLYTHQGLTYGGWILPPRHLDCVDFLELWESWLAYCRAAGITRVVYKPLPYIYASMPSQEDIYALFRSGAVLTECNISTAIDLAANPGLATMRRRLLRKAQATGAVVRQVDTDEGYAAYHALLSACLAERHGAKPVHTLAELLLLRSRFPAEISLWTAELDGGTIEAGVLVYNTATTVHCQYIASSPRARELNLLSLLFDALIARAAAGEFGAAKRYFDFGISNEDHGRYLNAGLYRQKASFGASGVAYTRYELELV